MPIPRRSRVGSARSAISLAVAVLVAGCAVQLRPASSGAPSSESHGPGIELVIRVVFGAARLALPEAVDAAAMVTQASPSVRAELAAAQADAVAGFDALDRDLAAYAEHPTTANRCRVHAAERAVLDGTVAVLAIARDLRAEVPPATVAALGAVAPLVDALQPDCSPPPPTSGRARMRSALLRDP